MNSAPRRALSGKTAGFRALLGVFAFLALAPGWLPAAEPTTEELYRKVSTLISQEKFETLSPEGQKALATLATAAETGYEINAPVCFAPGTDPEVAYAFERAVAENAGPRYQHFPFDRWTTTATDGFVGNAPGNQGVPVTLTYSFVPDGTTIPTELGFASGTSVLFSRMDMLYGTTAAWQAQFHQSFQRWGELNGINYVFEMNDDGSPTSGLPGVVGVRGDLRIGMKLLDGASNVLAYNNTPDNGDMVFDSGDAIAANFGSPVFFQNVIQHEHGHGHGLAHVCPINEAILMEPFVSVSYHAVRHDDIQSSQRHYGDRYEDNDSFAQATPLGTQVAFFDFEADPVGTQPPTGFEQVDGATLNTLTAGGENWLTGNEASAASASFALAGNATRFAYINDDRDSGQNGGEDLAIRTVMPVNMTLSPQARLNFDYRFERRFNNGVAEVYVRDSGGPWNLVYNILETDNFARTSPADNGWVSASVDISAFAGLATQVAFRYNDENAWSEGIGIDNVELVSGGAGFHIDNVSVDDDSDEDWYSFTLATAATLDISLAPVGLTYDDQPQNQSTGACDQVAPQRNSLSIQDMSLELRDFGMALATANANPAGMGEAISTTVGPGVYFARVISGSADDIQLYSLDVNVTPLAGSVVSINDASVMEGDSGTTDVMFNVTVLPPSANPVSMNFQTADGTAQDENGDGDYVSNAGVLMIPALAASGQITVTVNGDLSPEGASENFFVNLSNLMGVDVSFADAQGQGTIFDDDSAILSIADAWQAEGDAGTSDFLFELSLSQAQETDTTVAFTVSDGTATLAGSDYVTAAGVVVIPAFQRFATLAVTVNGDAAPEANEDFAVALGAPMPASVVLGNSMATGHILNDDGLPADLSFGTNSGQDQFSSFRLNDAATVANLGGGGGQFYSGGDFADHDFSTFYAWNFNTNAFTSFDTATGAPTILGVTPPTVGRWTGLAWDKSTSTMFAADSGTNLFTVNIANGAATPIGTMAGINGVMGLAVHPSTGQLYAIEFGEPTNNDRLFAVNKSTGAATPIGSLGFNVAATVQDCDFDDATGQLFLCALTQGGGNNDLRLVDLATGASTLQSSIGAGGFVAGAWGIADFNEPPMLAPIPDQSITMGSSLTGLPFVVDEGITREEDFQSLQIFASSDNQQLLPDANISINYAPDGLGDATGGTLDLTPDPAFYGTATVTVMVRDQDAADEKETLRRFTLTVNPPGACTCFPTLDMGDGKYVTLAGSNLGSLDNTSLLFSIGVPFNDPEFNLSIFDGDSGRANGSAMSPPGPNDWQAGVADYNSAETEFVLYADPLKTGDPTGLSTLATFLSNGMNVPGVGGVPANFSVSSPTMPDGAAFDITAPVDASARNPNGNFFYLLEVRFANQGAAADALQSFKLCADTQVGVTSVFEFSAPLASLPDFAAAYPADTDGMPPVAPGDGGLVYDGQWSFFANVGPGETVLEIWDGDLDRADDTDDPNTTGIPAFNTGTSIMPEGALAGRPPEDGASLLPYFVISPAAFYEVFAPSDRINAAATNANPSGGSEWELFRLGAAGVPNSDANLGAATLETGPWEVRVQGVDFGNLNAFHSETKELFACDNLPLLATTGAMGGFVTGTRRSAGGFAGIAIALEGVTHWGEAVSRRTYTGADGSFRFDELGAGTYSVWPEADPSQMVERFLAAGEKLGSLRFDASGFEAVPPAVASARVRSELEVEATFSEPMGQGALDAFSYAVSGSGRGTLAENPARVEAATSGRNVSSYLLAWDEGDMVFGGDITITVGGARDLAGNPMGPDNAATHLSGALPVELAVFGLE